LLEAENTPGWHYSQEEDKMAGTMYFASVVANEEIQFQFPYNGGSTAKITIREKEGNTDIMLRVSKGQFLTHYDGTTCRIKFDDEQPKAYSLNEASSGSSDVVFIQSEAALIKKMKTAKVMLVEAEFYDHGKETMEFQVEGLTWEH